MDLLVVELDTPLRRGARRRGGRGGRGGFGAGMVAAAPVVVVQVAGIEHLDVVPGEALDEDHDDSRANADGVMRMAPP